MRSLKSTPWVVSLTFFDGMGRLDEGAARAHLRRLCDGGQSIYVGSTNVGEGFALDPDEQSALLSIACSELKGRTGVRAAGLEARSVAEARANLRIAEQSGVDAAHLFQLDTGHGTAKPDPNELEQFYTAAIDGSSIPIVLSNYPSLGYVVPIDLIGRLLDRFPQIIAFRDSAGDLSYLSELIGRFDERIEIYAVGVRNLANSLMLGATGAFTTEANIAPRLVTSVLDRFDAGDLAGMRSSHARLVRLHCLLARHGGASGKGMKPLLEYFGCPGGPYRTPRSSIGALDVQALVEGVSALALDDLSDRAGR